jgi:iron complex transport system substrate-binding protein
MTRRIQLDLAMSMIAWTCFAVPLPAAAQASPVTKSGANIPTRDVVDETGRHVRVPLDPHSIVSLAPNLTEIIYALGAQDRLVGVSDFSDKPPAAKEKRRIGLPMNPSLEAIVGLKPDLVLATAVNRWETVDALAQMGIPVYGIDPHTVKGTLDSIMHIGDLIGATTEAREVVAKLQQRLDALKAKLAGDEAKTALFVVWQDPLISIGDRTFIADALGWAGAESVVKTRQDWPLVSLEEIVRLEPDYIIYASREADSEAGIRDAAAKRLNQLREESGWRSLAAVREGHVAVISDEVNLPAPGLVDAIEQLARQIHPNAFKQQPQMQGAANQLGSVAHRRGLELAYRRVEEISCAR